MNWDQPVFEDNEDKKNLSEIGAVLAVLGFGFGIDQLLKTGWLAPLFVLISSIYMYIRSVVEKKSGLLIVGALFAGCSASLFVLLNSIISLPELQKVGCSILTVSIGFLLIPAGSLILHRKVIWWAFLVGWIIFSVSIPFMLNRMDFLFFALWIVSGIGSALLIWGLVGRLFGLIIPGSILVTSGAGVYAAWANVSTPNGLTETGIMLVWFALGWGAIIVFSRVITTRFVWWPLIPGGVLAVVGWGLYSGGNPNNALSFIGNTGSIGVLIFGLYLLLIRRSMKG